MSNYILEVDEEQLKHISKALDFYARIQTGQVSELVNPYMVALPDSDYKEVENILRDLKKHMFPNLPENAFYSIKSKHIQDPVRQLVDIFEVIRYELLSDEEEDIKKPFNWSSQKSLPTLKKLEK